MLTSPFITLIQERKQIAAPMRNPRATPHQKMTFSHFILGLFSCVHGFSSYLGVVSDSWQGTGVEVGLTPPASVASS